MSLQFSNTTTKGGIIQQIESNCGFNDGDISGNSVLLAKFTAEVNLALDRALSIIFKSDGTWQFDDSNHTDSPFITTDLVSGQRAYSFTKDGSDNLILEIFKVLVMDEDGVYQEIDPVDQQMSKNSRVNVDSFVDGQDETGTVTRYDKTGNAIYLDKIPSYSKTDGIKMLISREGSYFSTTDTTKKPGILGLYHEYLALVPSYKYARNHNLPNTKRLWEDIERFEEQMRTAYGKRNKDIKRRMRPAVEDNK